VVKPCATHGSLVDVDAWLADKHLDHLRPAVLTCPVERRLVAEWFKHHRESSENYF